MIVFKKLRWKNFLSTGNSFTEVDFTTTKTTLIVGQNGAGKSTMLDALSFALFGKGHRNISKPQLINSVNNKHCVVEVEFDVAGSAWKVVRGIKPNLFEIWKGDVMINQNSHAKEYQRILEQNIIKLNHKSFHQIVVLGSSSFIPFMQLASSHRREVIEDLLDINVFSKMNVILKEKNSALKEQMRENQHQMDLVNNNIETHKKHIKDLKAINNDRTTQIQDEISSLESEIETLTSENVTLGQYIEEHQESVLATLERLRKAETAGKEKKHELQAEIRNMVKETKFFEENTTCPTCSQDISDDLRDQKRKAATEKAKTMHGNLETLSKGSAALESDINLAIEAQETIKNKQHQLLTNNTTIQRLQGQANTKKNDLTSLQVGHGSYQEAEEKLRSYISTKNDLTERRLDLSDQRAYNDVIGEMLKDTGIKTKIVKQYIPVINKFVNQYLQILDFFVHFDLDESFQETIRSRHRDAFTYDSFSEGEKQRIDLALLFTWRLVAKMKNSVATNLLILDETFDSSLDHDGVENLLKILESCKDDTNVFVISHKGDILDGKFDRKLEFVKEKNFSKIAA